MRSFDIPFHDIFNHICISGPYRRWRSIAIARLAFKACLTKPFPALPSGCLGTIVLLVTYERRDPMNLIRMKTIALLPGHPNLSLRDGCSWDIQFLQETSFHSNTKMIHVIKNTIKRQINNIVLLNKKHQEFIYFISLAKITFGKLRKHDDN